MREVIFPRLAGAIALALLAWPALAADTAKPAYSPYVGKDYPVRPLFGDTHLHTSMSMDAGAFGARLGPAEAYRFARGEQVTSSTGQPVRLSRPLDFLVISDHSDGFGFFPLILAGGPSIMADPQGKKWHDMITGGQGHQAALDIINNFSKGTISEAIMPLPGTEAYRSAWQENVKAAEAYNDPGSFTALIGYEWTSNTGGNNLHRNVIYRDGSELAGQLEPYTTMAPLGSDNPRDLWKWMADYQQKTGGQVLAIAHNGNLSNGLMFPLIESFTGKPVDREYAEQRARWEPLYEVTQIKGDGETHPLLSPNDEFADFETLDAGNLNLSVKKTPQMLEFEYARAALKNGLKLEQELGSNPYQFGMIGSTDSHTGLATGDEDNFFGKASNMEPSPKRLSKDFFQNFATGLVIKDWQLSASGYAAVWASENTREAIWDAMARKETYATTGPRMVVRLFAGWDFDAADTKGQIAATGYAKGVSMGGELIQAPAGKAPTFLVSALKDPLGANLDRYQIVKGWLAADGSLQEKVYDVAWSDGRKPGKDGKLPPVGNTVDLATATWSNSIGASELVAYWSDPDFDAAQSAFYYGRVIEIPTPRWTAYDVQRFSAEVGKEVTMVLQERAYTSPVWYKPGK
jgi:hypothetical protein